MPVAVGRCVAVNGRVEVDQSVATTRAVQDSGLSWRWMGGGGQVGGNFLCREAHCVSHKVLWGMIFEQNPGAGFEDK